MVALRLIKRRGDGGRGIAIPDNILDILAWTLCAVIVAYLFRPPWSDRPNQAGPARRVVTSLQVGECTADIPEGGVKDTQVVPCDQSHRIEVYARLGLPDGGYPGDDAVNTRANEMCDSRLDDVPGGTDLPDGIEVSSLNPARDAWATGDRTIICILYFPAGRTGRVLSI